MTKKTTPARLSLFQKAFKTLRARGYTQRDVAREMDLTEAVFNKKLNGRAPLRKVDMLALLWVAESLKKP